MRPALRYYYYNSGGSDPFSSEMQAVIDLANSEEITKPVDAVLRVYDSHLFTPLKESAVIPWEDWDTLNVYGYGSMEFGTINLINPSSHRHTVPGPLPDFKQPQSAGDSRGVRSVNNAYINTNFKCNEYSGIEINRTVIVNISEDNATAVNGGVWGARTLAASTGNTTRIAPMSAVTPTGSRNLHASGANFASANHKALYVVTTDGVSGASAGTISYRNGVKTTNASTKVAPDIANDEYFLGRNLDAAGGHTPGDYYPRYSDMLARYRGNWTDAMELEFRTIWTNFLTAVDEAFFFNLSSTEHILVFDMGQSNSEGQGEAGRLFLTEFSDLTPDRVEVFFKPDRTSSDNGAFNALQLGVNSNQLADPATTVGAEASLMPRLRDRVNRKVYCMKCALGGTSLHTDWNESTPGSLFQVATEYYFTPAIEKLRNRINPGDTIKVILLWHQGEADADAINGPLYKGRLESFWTAFRAYDPLLANAPLFITGIDPVNAVRIAMNQDMQDYCSENPNSYFIDISDQPNKDELTTEQKGGVSPTAPGGDDNHFSYLAQIAKGERIYNKIVEIGYI